MNWQTPLPNGGDALGWEVEITAHLELTRKPLMRLLAISGSLRRESYNSALLAAAAAEVAPAASTSGSGAAWTQSRHTTRTSKSAPLPVALLKTEIAAGRRDPLRDARIQRIGPRRAQECARLGLTTFRDEPATTQAGCGRRSEPGRLRRRSGRRRSCARSCKRSEPGSSPASYWSPTRSTPSLSKDGCTIPSTRPRWPRSSERSCSACHRQAA